ncbi:serine hydrolase [Nonomuraea sediminis]|uniref:serine hydrolase n=1 Tax=Nonomuraea sediminis TaxID=2835864 RepID=UPI001BDCF79F|nr:serine hydrolase [Nonomuraea sediminis]
MRVRWWAGVAALVVVSGCGTERALEIPSAVQEPKVRDCVLKYRDRVAEAQARTRLRREIADYVARQPGRIAYSAHDLVTGITLGYREHEDQMITASGAKVDVLTALLLRHGKLGAEERDLASRMISESDNAAADALWSRVGAAYGMNRFYRQVGLRQTRPGSNRFWSGTNTSPADRVRLLRLLVKGGYGLARAHRDMVLGLMSRVEPDQAWGVSAAARPGDQIALKDGWTPRPFDHHTWTVTSYGRITGPGRDLLLSIQTDLQPGEGQGIQAIEGLAKLIGYRLSSLHQLKTRPCSGTPYV